MTDERRPTGDSVNYGIQVAAGGVFNANAAATGPGASAYAEVSGSSLADDPVLLAQIRKQVGDLLAALTAQPDRGDAPAAVVAAVREGAHELAEEEPERSAVVSALKRAAAGITSAGALAGSLHSILDLLGVRS